MNEKKYSFTLCDETGIFYRTHWGGVLPNSLGKFNVTIKQIAETCVSWNDKNKLNHATFYAMIMDGSREEHFQNTIGRPKIKKEDLFQWEPVSHDRLIDSLENCHILAVVNQ